MPINILEIKGLKKSFDSLEVLKNINLFVEKGDIITIKGKSGSGKSTLLNILGLIETPDSGEYIFDNNKITSKNSSVIRNEEIGFVFQNYNLINGLSVIENIKLPFLYCKKDIPDYENNIVNLLKLLQITDLKEKNVVNLSGGEKQRVAIARALSLNPQIILADEPTGNLDPINKKNIVDIFKTVNELYNITILVVTHDDVFDQISKKKYQIENGVLYEIHS